MGNSRRIAWVCRVEAQFQGRPAMMATRPRATINGTAAASVLDFHWIARACRVERAYREARVMTVMPRRAMMSTKRTASASVCPSTALVFLVVARSLVLPAMMVRC